MIRDLFQLGVIGFEVVGAWVRSEMGAADYRIVRLVFVSVLAACGAFGLVKIAAGFLNVFCRLVIYYVPLFPEFLLLLGCMSREEYSTYSYRLFRRIWHAIGMACDRLEQAYCEWARRHAETRKGRAAT